MEAEVQGYLIEFRILRDQIRDTVDGINYEAANCETNTPQLHQGVSRGTPGLG